MGILEAKRLIISLPDTIDNNIAETIEIKFLIISLLITATFIFIA